MLLSDLIVSQNEVRHDADHLQQMVDFVKTGGLFTQEAIGEWTKHHGGRPNPPLVGITLFPDDTRLLHDGHNRAIAIFLGGRDHLDKSEYFIKKYDYEHYTVLEPHNNWFTPFDPKTELRRAEFGDYKSQARRMYESRPGEFEDWVTKNREEYCIPRDLFTVEELVERVLPRLYPRVSHADRSQRKDQACVRQLHDLSA